MHVYQPKEVVIIHNVERGVLQTIIQHANFATRCIHLLNSGENLPRIKHCEKQVYQVEIYNKYFGQVMPEEYKTWTIAMQSYCSCNIAFHFLLPVLEVIQSPFNHTNAK